MDTARTVHVLVQNKWVAEEKAERIFVCRAGNSNSFCGIWVQSISTLGFLYHTSNTAVLPRGGEEGEERENGEKNTVTGVGILILKGCEI